MEKKQQISIANLCQGCPSQFAEYLVILILVLKRYRPTVTLDTLLVATVILQVAQVRQQARHRLPAQAVPRPLSRPGTVNICGMEHWLIMLYVVFAVKLYFSSQGRLWDWDSVDADNLILNGTGGGNNAVGGPPGFGGGSGAPVAAPGMYPHETAAGGDGVMSGAGYGDENRAKRPTTSATGGGAVMSAGAANYAATGGARATTATSQNVLPPSSSSGARNWGFSNPTSSAVGGAGRQGEGGVEPLFEHSNKISSTSAGNTTNQQKRPHTAHVTGRSAGLSGDDENEEVFCSLPSDK